jgi:hypothetical protein
VILVGDFHQFPPVARKQSAPLYWPCNPAKDKPEDMLGRQIYEKFTTVVRLTEQVRTTDPVWQDLLQHVRHGSCRGNHLQILRDLIITSPKCPPTDFNQEPWNDAVLVTPRHGVRRQWNEAAVAAECSRRRIQLFHVTACDTIGGKQLSLNDRFAIASTKDRGGKRKERGGLQDVVDLAIGLKVMVTFNVNTNLDIAAHDRGLRIHRLSITRSNDLISNN